MGVPAKIDLTQHRSPFLEAEYKSDRNFLKAYHYQAAYMLSVVYNYDYDHLLTLMQEIFVPNENGFKEAKFRVFKKDKHGDRVPLVMSTREFFNTVSENGWHLSPSLVGYTHTDVEQSVNAAGTEMFIEFRRLYKGKRGEVPKGSDAWNAFNEIQNALKIFNNAQSGGMSSSGTPLFNKSGHTTLTSTCRALTSTANLINERLITGNRLLLSYRKTMEGFLAQLQYADQELIQEVITEYGMSYATVDQVMEMVTKCANYYWNNPSSLGAIRRFLEALNPLELTVILCTLDLRGLYVTNAELMQKFFNEWCATPAMPEGTTEDDYPKPANSDYKILCITKLGIGASKAQINHLNAYHVSVEQRWEKFLRAFFKSEIPPTGIFNVKEIVRESVMTSDTDSVIYSVDMIIDDYAKDSDTALKFNGVLTYFIRCIAVDQHARLSRNMNVSKKYQNRLNMKNEYLFASYVTTSMSKHYYALQLMVEGVLNIDKETGKLKPALELKGVHLRGVKIAELVRNFTNKLMRKVLDALYTRNTMSAPHILHEVGNIERELRKNIEEGGWAWLTKNSVKSEEVYKTPDSSIYFYHKLWESVLSVKYGEAPQLPYKAYKVNLNLTGKKRLQEFYDGLKDENFKATLMNFMKDKSDLSSLYIPTDMIEGIGGIPEEFLPAVDVRQLIQQNLKSIYAILESLGLFILNSKTTRLVSDEH
ncbi:hypothetical protein D3C81_375880 [compost metagenome]